MRAEAVLLLAQTLGMPGNYETEVDLLRPMLAELESYDPALALRVEAQWIGVARLVPESRAWAEERLRALAPRAEEAAPESVVLLANLALQALESNAPAEVAVAHARLALTGGWLWDLHTFQYSYAANVLMWTDRFEEAEQAWADGLARLGGQGRPVMAALAHGWRSHLRMRSGDVRGAEADARLARDIVDGFEGFDWAPARPYITVHVADVLLEQDVAAAGALLDTTGRWEEQVAVFLDGRARWRLASGDPTGALADFLAAGEALRVRGGHATPAILPWRTGAAMAAAAGGDLAAARRWAEEEMALAARVGTSRSVGLALRARAAAAGSGAERADLLAAAAEALDAAGARLDQAKALVDLGMALRRARRPVDAREPLRAGLDLAVRCGTPLLAERARHELLASGARPRRTAVSGVDALTPSERRVAELALEGLSNREIAQRLFVSARTVAVHLTHAYQKLGITGGRGELAARLTAVLDEDEPDPSHLGGRGVGSGTDPVAPPPVRTASRET